MATKDDVGRYGEDVATLALADLGWEILARNWRCPVGEIDIVGVDDDEVVVVEVKTRRSRAFGSPTEAVTRDKVSRLRRLAAAWLASQERRFDGVRVDVISVEIRSGVVTIEHLKGVE